MDPNTQDNNESKPLVPGSDSGAEASQQQPVGSDIVAPSQDFSQPSDQPAPVSSPIVSEPQPQPQVQPSTVVPNQVTPASGTTVAPLSGQFPTDQTTAKPKRKPWFKAAIIAVVALVLIGGTSSAAYFAYYVPNKPENILAEAVKNTLQQKQTQVEGVMTMDIEGTSMKVTLKGQSDLTARTASGEGTLTFSGVSVSMEFRYTEDNIYFKFKDLGTVKSLLIAYAGMLGEDSSKVSSFVDSVAVALDDQWIVVDSTLLKQAKMDCLLNNDTLFTNDDMKLLEDRYTKNPFATVESTTSDNVNGVTAQKFELKIDGSKATQYTEGLKDLSYMKKIRECTGEDSTTESTSPGDNSKVTLWVDKSSKRIIKMETTGSVNSDSGQRGSGTVILNVSYNPVSVEKPENTKPLLQVSAELISQFQQAFPELGQLLEDDLSGEEISPDILFN